jgi:hypothetical protein
VGALRQRSWQVAQCAEGSVPEGRSEIEAGTRQEKADEETILNSDE